MDDTGGWIIGLFGSVVILLLTFSCGNCAGLREACSDHCKTASHLTGWYNGEENRCVCVDERQP